MSAARVYQFTARQVEETCCVCGVLFTMPETLRQSNLDNRSDLHRRSFFCPNGHQQNYVGKTDAELSREEAQRQRARAEEAERARAAAEKKLRDHQERVSNGVCPCCRRSFTNLRRHMASKHPSFGGGAS